MIDFKEETAVKSLIMYDYVGDCMRWNIEKWQRCALKENPNIVDIIKNAKKNNRSLDSVFGPVLWKVEDYFDANIEGRTGQKKLKLNLTSYPKGEKPDCRFLAPCFDESANIDFSNAKKLWIKIDCSRITGKLFFYFAIEDLSKKDSLFEPKKGSPIELISKEKSSIVRVDERGYIRIPKRFKGYLVYDLSKKNFTNPTPLKEWDFKKCGRFQMAFTGQRCLYENFFIESFNLSYEKNEKGVMPELKLAWDFNNLKRKTDYRKDLLPWYGEFVGKHLTGLVLNYRIYPTVGGKKAIEEIVDALQQTQQEDGYLGVYAGCSRYSLFTENWDLWNQYHAIIGLIEWYKYSLSNVAFTIAKKALDCILEAFKGRSYIVAGGMESNRSIAHAFAEFYTVTGEERYLIEAERIIMEDCQEENGWYKMAKKGEAFFKTSCTRWEVLHTIMALSTLYRATNKEEYLTVLKNLWATIYLYDVHNNGGFSTNEGAKGNPYEDGVIETCCSIAWAALTNEMFKSEKFAVVADAFEITYYNAILGSLSSNKKYCTYNTPMNTVKGACGQFNGKRVPSQVDSAFQFNKRSKDMNCCQANLARGLGEIARWAYVNDDNELYVNYYGQSEAVVRVGGKYLRIKQESKYPLNGKSYFTVIPEEDGMKFTLNFRIPHWSLGARIIVEGKEYKMSPDRYFSITKNWKRGERASIEIEYGIRVTWGRKEQKEYASIFYGPILLTLDEKFCPGISRNEEIIFTSLKSKNVAVWEDDEKYVTCKAQTTSGKEITLVDFASAGKEYNNDYSRYYSWVRVLKNV